MKKLWAMLLAILMVVSLGACGGETGIRKDFKAAMDSYEEFVDEYIEFLEKYQSSANSADMISDYLEYLNEYAELSEKMSAWTDKDLNSAELSYYAEVSLRVSQKLADVGQ